MGPDDVEAKTGEGDAGERVYHIVGVVSRRCAVRDGGEKEGRSVHSLFCLPRQEKTSSSKKY